MFEIGFILFLLLCGIGYLFGFLGDYEPREKWYKSDNSNCWVSETGEVLWADPNLLKQGKQKSPPKKELSDIEKTRKGLKKSVFESIGTFLMAGVAIFGGVIICGFIALYIAGIVIAVSSGSLDLLRIY